ncbi:MAG: oligosaccharide flippase family protein [Candidatus Omnitrophota bacterium]
MRKLNDVFYRLCSNIVIFCITVVKGFFVPAYLGPSMYGIVSFLTLVKTVLGFSSIGVDQAYLRLSLAMRGGGESHENIKRLQNTVFSFLAITGTAGSIITVALPFIFPRETPDLQCIMVFAFGVTAVQHLCAMIGGYFYNTCVIDKRFVFISRLNVLQIFLNVVILLATVFYWKIYGVFLAELISVLVVQFFYTLRCGTKPSFEFDKHEFKKIFKYAIPFSLTNVSFYFARMIDKTIILFYLTMGDLGLYTFALNITTHSRILYKSVADVLSPYFLEEIGTSEYVFSLGAKIKFHTLCIAALSTFISINIILFGDVLQIILPKYMDSIFVLKILMINSYVSTITVFQSLLLGAPNIKKQNLLNVFMAVAGAVNCGISIVLIKVGWGINGVAWGTLVSMVVWQGLVLWASHKHYLETLNGDYYVRLILPVGLMLATVGYTQRHMIIESTSVLFVCVGLNLLVFAIYFKETWRIIQIIRKWLSARVKKNEQ